MTLVQKHCRPCEGSDDKLDAQAAQALHAECPAWRIEDDRLLRDLTLDDFSAVIRFVQEIAALAEDEGHHPDLLVHGYKHLQVRLQTHAIGGLSENDFILAAKIDRLRDRQDG